MQTKGRGDEVVMQTKGRGDEVVMQTKGRGDEVVMQTKGRTMRWFRTKGAVVISVWIITVAAIWANQELFGKGYNLIPAYCSSSGLHVAIGYPF